MTDHIGIGDSEQLLARVCMPHPHVIVTAGSIELRRPSDKNSQNVSILEITAFNPLSNTTYCIKISE